jgi:hypothetical protein
MRIRRKQQGIAVVEVAVTVALMMMTAIFAAEAMFAYRHAQDRYIHQQAARWAAAGQLQRYQAGAPLDSLPPEGVLSEAITLKTDVQDGQGPWAGFDRVTVTAEVKLPNGKQTAEQIRGYVPRRSEP